MNKTDALYLLFEYDFGSGHLFNNQLDLVNSLISNPKSSYYTEKDNKEEYAKAINRLKAYISQLLSKSATRKITRDFSTSLRVILANKLINSNVNPTELADDIIADIQKRNQKILYNSERVLNSSFNTSNNFIQDLLDSEYISVFTTREIKFGYEILNKKISFIEFLLDNLLDSLKKELPLKYYRFNFPLEQSCQLFWRSLRKELVNHLLNNKSNLSSVLSVLKLNNLVIAPDVDNSENYIYRNIEEKIASELLNFLSKNGIVNVFHSKVPVYLVPSVALNPNMQSKANTYLFFQSGFNSDFEEIHKLATEELILWKFFVWDNLKKNKSGVLIKYSPKY